MTWKSQRRFSEEAFLQATFREFIKCWGSGKRARIFVESMNGGAYVSFSTFLGNPGAPHINPRKFNMAASTSGHPEGQHDSQNGGNPHQTAFKKKSKKKTERDNAHAAEFQRKKKKEDIEKTTAAGTEKTSGKEEETEAKDVEEAEDSVVTTPSLDLSPESRKFIFVSPVQETLRHDTSRDASMILDDVKEQQDKIEVDNDGQNDNFDEDKVDEDIINEDKVKKDKVDKDKVNDLYHLVRQYKLGHNYLMKEQEKVDAAVRQANLDEVDEDKVEEDISGIRRLLISNYQRKPDISDEDIFNEINEYTPDEVNNLYHLVRQFKSEQDSLIQEILEQEKELAALQLKNGQR